MLLKWARWLPYWIIAKLITKTYSSDGQGLLKLDKEYNVTYYRLGEGEFLVYSNDIYNKIREKKQEKSIKKMDKKIDKVNKILDSDYSLRQQMKEQFEYEIEQDKLDY